LAVVWPLRAVVVAVGALGKLVAQWLAVIFGW